LLENPIGTGLHRQLELAAEFRQAAEAVDQFIGEILRV
jgi:hypothetical protein